MTTRYLISLVASVAVFFGFLASLNTHLREWEARRAQMGVQRDVTQSVISKSTIDLSTLEGGGPHVTAGPGNGTREWSIEVMRFAPESGRLGPARARVSGSNGEFALGPIRVEVLDPALRGPWLASLLRAYRERGWACEIVDAPR